MIQRIILFICLLFSSMLNGQEVVLPFKVMTYNIRLDTESDMENRWENRKGDMVEYLLSKNPDFLGVQEALPQQILYLNHGLKDHNYSGVGRDDGKDEGEYSAIFYHKDRWTNRWSKTKWLSPSPNLPSFGWDAACKRVVTYGMFINSENDSVLVMNTHLDHMGESARSNSIELIGKIISDFDPDIPVILMGDFNFEPESHLYKKITLYLRDTHILCNDDQMSLKGTFNGFTMKNKKFKRIDYMMLNENLELLKYKIEEPKTNLGLQLSDHFPVYVELKIDK